MKQLSFLKNIKFRLKQRDLAIIIAVLCMVAVGAWWQFMRQPSQQRITTLKDDIVKVEKDIEVANRAKRELPNLREQIAGLEAERVAFLQELPTENEVAQLVSRLRIAAINSNVLMTQVGSATSNNTDGVQGVRPLPFSVSTSGNYPSTLTFLRQLESFQRFTKIRQVDFAVDDDGIADPKLNTNYDFVVYAFVGNDPGPGDGDSEWTQLKQLNSLYILKIIESL